MTRAHDRAHWSGVPSLSQPLLAAMLRGLAMLVLNVAAFFGMSLSRPARECHAEATPERLPRRTSDPMEKQSAARRSQTQEALIMSRPRSGDSKGEGALTNACRAILEADEVRVPGEGRGPAITSMLALPSGCNLTAEQALKPVLAPALAGDTD